MNPEVLIIDDEWAVSRAISARLEASGFSTRIAPTGEEGLQSITESTPDVVILDLRMPDIDGLEVLRRLRAEPNGLNVPVVMVTANVQDSVRGEAMALGARAFFGKPFDQRDLVETLRRLVSPKPVAEGVES